MIGLAEYPESRRSAFTDALDAAGIPWTTDLQDCDVIVSGRRKATLRKHRKPLYYRLRGNLWRDRDSRWLDRIIDPVSWRLFEGVICPDYRMRNCLTANTPFGDAPIVPLSIQPDNWPTHYHIGDKLRMVSLTNADYDCKVYPIIDQINIVNEWCERNEGHWRICGNGEYAHLIDRATEGREHVSYCGHVDAQERLTKANTLLHFSTMDIQAPNAVLEGMASQIPVVTSENNIFQNLPSPAVTGRDIVAELDQLQDPMHRKAIVDQQQSYLQANHTPAVVGKQIASVL